VCRVRERIEAELERGPAKRIMDVKGINERKKNIESRGRSSGNYNARVAIVFYRLFDLTPAINVTTFASHSDSFLPLLFPYLYQTALLTNFSC
jgi:hypothetical protein